MQLARENEEFQRGRPDLLDSRGEFAAVADGAPVDLVVMDGEGKLLGANCAAATMLGVEREGLLDARSDSF